MLQSDSHSADVARVDDRRDSHSTRTMPTDGEIAQDAGVQTLVLTHIMPYRDLETMRRDAEAAFDGEVIVAEDSLSTTL